jgi:hypothetical protein
MGIFGQAVKAPQALYEPVEVLHTQRIALEQAHFDLRVGYLDQALEEGDLVAIHTVDDLLSEAAEQEIHLLGASMGSPPQRPAPSHSKITGHDPCFPALSVSG